MKLTFHLNIGYALLCSCGLVILAWWWPVQRRFLLLTPTCIACLWTICRNHPGRYLPRELTSLVCREQTKE